MGVSKNMGVPYFGVLIIRILLLRTLFKGPLFSETPLLLGALRVQAEGGGGRRLRQQNRQLGNVGLGIGGPRGIGFEKDLGFRV